jgi:hypothetical protein
VSWSVLPFPAMEPSRQSVPEAGAYRMLHEATATIRQAERALKIVEEAAPDVERARHLAAIRAALQQLETFIRPATGLEP